MKSQRDSLDKMDLKQIFIKKKLSNYVFKAKFNCLVVDTRVRSTWVALILHCDCCEKGQVETLDHMLNPSDIAKLV